MNSFLVHEPRATETPVIVEVPHAGLEIDPASLAYCVAPARSIGHDADLYVDRLFDSAPDLGAHLIHSTMSRYVCDLNRSESDLDEQTSPAGTASSAPHGIIWRKTTEGRPALNGPLPGTEVERRLDMIYRPYHRKLQELIAGKLERFGVAVLLCGHSMPSFGRLGERRADIVPGTQGRTTAGSAFIDMCDRVAALRGYDVAHDSPYRGGFTTSHYGSPGSRVHAIQIELARRLYMDEASLTPHDRFGVCATFCAELVAGLSRIRL